MSTGLHKDLDYSEGHVAHSLQYANTAARTGASGLVAADTGRVAKQLDDNTFWILRNHSPVTWAAVGAGGSGGQTDSVAGASGITNTGNNVDAVLAPTFGSAAGTICQGNDSRLSDDRDPTAHAGDHSDGGSDEVEVTNLGGFPGGTTNFLRADGSFANPGAGGSVFGQDYQTAESLTESSTTSTAWQTKLAMATPALTGTYRIAFSCRVWQSNLADSVQVLLYNATDDEDVVEYFEFEPKDASNRYPVAAFAEVTFTGASKTFQIEYRQQRGSTAYIDQARIEIWRVG